MPWGFAGAWGRCSEDTCPIHRGRNGDSPKVRAVYIDSDRERHDQHDGNQPSSESAHGVNNTLIVESAISITSRSVLKPSRQAQVNVESASVKFALQFSAQEVLGGWWTRSEELQFLSYVRLGDPGTIPRGASRNCAWITR